MDIEGLGPAIIETFVNEGMIAKTYDIYNLDFNKILSLEGFKETSANNIINSVNNSKTMIYQSSFCARNSAYRC